MRKPIQCRKGKKCELHICIYDAFVRPGECTLWDSWKYPGY